MKIFPSLAFVAAVALGGATLAQEVRTVTDDTGTEVTIPTEPKRIVSLHDSVLTVPLIELGAMPVGSHGRGTSEENAFIRASATVNGVDFDTSDIQWVGNLPADIERIAALEPDLILTTQWQRADVARLRQIAPTVLLDYTKRSDFDLYAMLADLTGTEDRMARLERRYDDQIARIRYVIDTETITVSTLHVRDGGFFAFNPYGNIGKVLVDAGFQRPAAIEAIPEGERIDISAERIQDFDGDFILTTYRSTAGDTPADLTTYAEAVLPSWCDALHACRTGQMFHLSRAEASATSYTALGQTAYAILSILGGREFEPFEER
ncbi:ABC transporter substrate-binding protein [Roseivivax sp. GX 12232]|uniref:ABC transporter substrate-binding protein n=1 Tax=Roseivivax sp. GX 12232 TaxID=2900547 RepID=UPI001E3ABABC|nr:ABC transporter substrate-binding protein [Roseivivax sp. GX 12232]MCE0505904.1 ABC transporter substrate-binding protein [Roseivivax sp. GX 12232]